MIQRLILAAILLTALGLVVVGWQTLQAHSLRQDALRLARDGRFAEAEPELKKVLTRNATDSEVISALALGNLHNNKLDAAEEYLTRWCESGPDDGKPYQLRMDVRHRLGRSERQPAERLRLMELALADGFRVLEREPTDEVRREVIWLLLSVGRFAEAERETRRCLALNPSDQWLLYLQAKACHGQGKLAEAEAALEPVVRDQPRFADALLLRATLFRETGKAERAVPLLRQILDLPRCPRKDCLYQLGLALGSVGEKGEAGRVMAELDLLRLRDAVAHDHFPSTPAMRVQIAEAMLGAGQSEEGKTLLDTILAEDPDFAPAHRALAHYYEQKGQTDRAAEHRRKMTR